MEQKKESKKSRWTIEGATLTITMPSSKTKSFDLAKIMPDYEAQDENIRFVFQYGVKQNLSDEVAGQKDSSDETKLDLMASRFEELVRGEIKTKREKSEMFGKTALIAKMKAQGLDDETIEKILAK